MKGIDKIPRIKGLKDVMAACTAKKAKDVIVLDMRKFCTFTQYFIIVSGESSIQIKAIAAAVQERFKKKKIKIYHTEGREGGRWILMDAGHFIIHLFLKEVREFYNLEFLWADAPRLSLRKN